jgi:hypothetical protein
VSNSLQRDLGRHRSDPGAIATTSVIRPRPEELVDELPGLGSKPVPGSIGMVRPEVGCVEKQWPIRQPLEVLSLQGYSMSQLGVQQVQEARLCDVAMRELCIQVELLRRAISQSLYKQKLSHGRVGESDLLDITFGNDGYRGRVVHRNTLDVENAGSGFDHETGAQQRRFEGGNVKVFMRETLQVWVINSERVSELIDAHRASAECHPLEHSLGASSFVTRNA